MSQQDDSAPPDGTGATPQGAAAPGFGKPTDMGPQSMPDDQGQDQEGQQASPEEEQQLDLFLAQARNLIADPKNKAVREKVIALLSTGHPPEALATTAFYIFSAVYNSGTKAGHQFGPDVLLNAGFMIVEDLADFAEAKNIAEFDDDDIQNAYLKAVDMFREHNKDMLDPQAAQGELKSVNDAENQGTLDQVAPGLSKATGMIQQKLQAAAKTEGVAGAAKSGGAQK